MKERPIVYDIESIRAKLAGTKTQTRRLTGLKKVNEHPDWYNKVMQYGKYWIFCSMDDPKLDKKIKCPYGVVGDRLWTQEVWRVGAWDENNKRITIDYQADGYCQEWLEVEDEKMFDSLWQESTDDAQKIYGYKDNYKWEFGESPCRWRPAILMSHWASRFLDEIVDIRVERLQEITDFDITQEIFVSHEFCDEPTINQEGVHRCQEGARQEFIKGWDKINPQYPWDMNPWVWVITTKNV